jgi:glyoxylase-like metal-dependent hydrolase (beta-lactamase superfamily II)
MMPVARQASLAGGLALCIAQPALGQTSAYSDSLLPAIRRAATVVPGALPLAVHVLAFNHSRGVASSSVEGAPGDSVDRANVVFQIRYPRGWIMVDAGMDKEIAHDPPNYSQAAYDSVQLGLKDARLIVITHEHFDHIEGVLKSPYLDQIRPKTMLNREEVATLMAPGNPGNITLDSAQAAHYIVMDYDLLLPIAPGVVLIKAPGHTPGSQMVYVRTARGQEMVLVGDVAWATLGITLDRQKPEAVSDRLHENRSEIVPELAWLHSLAAQGVPLVVSHDDDSMMPLVRQGVLVDGLNLGNP